MEIALLIGFDSNCLRNDAFFFDFYFKILIICTSFRIFLLVIYIVEPTLLIKQTFLENFRIPIIRSNHNDPYRIIKK